MKELGIEMSIGNPTPTDIGWPDLTELKKGAYRVLGEVLAVDSEHTVRDRLQAASMVKSMDDTNVKVAEFEDKKERLDRGSPTEISDFSSLGAAASDLANRLSAVIGNRAGNDPRVVEVAGRGEDQVLGIEDRAEPIDVDAEATQGG